MINSLDSLLATLRQLWRARRDAIATQWPRSLPFGEYIVDRWEKARELGFGEGTSIYDSAVVIGKVNVGTNTWIGPNTVLDGSGGLTIGDNCSISAGVHIYSHNTVNWAISGGKEAYAYGPTRIGSRCFIGPLTIITKGVTIGEGTVIGAHSFVDRDLPAGSKAYGIPARVIASL